MSPDYGAFELAFSSEGLPVPGFLCLLNLLTPSESTIVIDRIRAAMAAPDRDAALHALLRVADWRSHLVAAVALLLIDDARPFVPDLWSAVRAGSWVSPQLLAVAAVRDADFVDAAAVRETEGFQVQPPTAPSPVLGQSATGARNELHRSAKELSALLALCDATSQGGAWATRVRADPELRDLLARDFDDGGGIAIRWLAEVRRLLSV